MKSFKHTKLASALAYAVGGYCLCVYAPVVLGADLVSQCAELGGNLENGACVYKATYAGSSLNDMGTEWFYLDEDWVLSSSQATIGGGQYAFSTFVFNVAQDGIERNIQLKNDASLNIVGGDAEASWGIGHLATGVGSVSALSNQGRGVLKIQGGSQKNAIALNALARDGGRGTIENLEAGTLLIEGGVGLASQGINALAKGGSSFGYLTNHGQMRVLGSSAQGDGLANGVYAFALNGGEAHLTNKVSGELTIEGKASPAIYYLAEGFHGSDKAFFLNEGTTTIAGHQAAGIYVLSNAQGQTTFENRDALSVTGGESAQGIFVMADSSGRVSFKNIQSGKAQFTASGTSAIGAMANNQGIVVIDNQGTMTLTSSARAPAIEVMASNGVATFNNLSGGTLNLLGTASFGALGTLGSNAGKANIRNEGTIHLNRYGITAFSDGSSQGKLHTTATGVVRTERQALFDGEVQETVQEKHKPITMIESDQTIHDVTNDNFKDFLSDQKGTVVLKDDWKQNASWDAGGRLIITDVISGSAVAKSIEQQVHETFGTGVVVQFDTSQTPGLSPSQKAKLTMDVVRSLKAENKFHAGTVITSEVLHHQDKEFLLGTGGDLTEDAGFQGIVGSSGIRVTDGKTLTLVGDQATETQIRNGTQGVITDALMSLQNGTLNLGHSLLTATQGRLSTVNYDAKSQINVVNGQFTLASVLGDGRISVNESAQATISGDLQTSNGTNWGVLTVHGKTTLSRNGVQGTSVFASQQNGFVNQKGTANFNGGLDIGKGTALTNMAGATVNAGAITMNELGTINAVKGSTINATSFDQNGIMRMLGTLNITGAMTVGDNSNTTLGGESTIGTLTVGRTAPTKLASGTGFFASPMGAQLRLTGNHYVDELDFVSGTVSVEDGATLTGKTLKDGNIGSTITVANGGTFGFSHDKSSLDRALKSYVGETDNKAILALNTDLHFANGGSLTVGTVADDRGTVNLGSDSLLLLGTTDLHGEALLNGTSAQQLHVEDGATIAMTDDLMWGNHYIMKGFDKPSSDEVMNVGIKDKDGKAMTLNRNDQGIFVTIGSDNILDKDKNYRLVNQMNWLLDGHQNTKSEQGDVAFLTSALLAKNGAEATNRMEALSSDAGVMAETQRMTAQVQTTMLDHATSARKGHGTFWVDGVFADIDSGDFKRTAGASSYDVDTTGFVFGADLPVAEDYRFGVAFSAQRGDLDGQNNLSSDIEGYGLSVYGGYTFASGLNVSGSLSYVDTTHEVSAFNLGAVKANVNATAWMLGGRVSMPYAFNRMWLTPYVGFDVMKINQDAFTASWSGKEAFHYVEADATILRMPIGVKTGTFVPLEMFGRSGTLNWDADLAFIPQFGDTEVDYCVSGVSNGHSDSYEGAFANDWLSTLKLGMSWQGAAGAFGIHYGVEKGDVRNLSHSIKAKASLYF